MFRAICSFLVNLILYLSNQFTSIAWWGLRTSWLANIAIRSFLMISSISISAWSFALPLGRSLSLREGLHVLKQQKQQQHFCFQYSVVLYYHSLVPSMFFIRALFWIDISYISRFSGIVISLFCFWTVYNFSIIELSRLKSEIPAITLPEIVFSV